MSGPGEADTISQGTLALERGDLQTQQALTGSLLQRRYTNRLLPDVISGQASRGMFHSGQTAGKAGRVLEDLQEDYGTAEVATQQNIGDLIRKQFLGTIGVQL